MQNKIPLVHVNYEETMAAEDASSKVLNEPAEEEELYESKILEELNWDDSGNLFDPSISPTDPGVNLLIRPLRTSDYDRGFPGVLSHLTRVGNVTREEFLNAFRRMKECKGFYFVTVIEDTALNRVIGSAALLIEQKFIHSCALRGRIEDVVVDNSHRGKQLGKLIVEVAKQIGKQVGCYKISLDCKDAMCKFYDQLGFSKEEGNSNVMTIRYRE